MNAVIIDDEKGNVANLAGLLASYCTEVSVVGTALNASEGADLIELLQPELVFLDIQMPGGNGFDMLQSLKTRNFELIFVTAFDHYGIQAVKFSAVDYLLKPIDTGELQTAVKRAGEKIQQRQSNQALENLMFLLRNRENKQDHRIALNTLKETRFVKTSEIVRCESSNSYTRFFLQNGTNILVSTPIFEYEELLKEYGFIRCHQSHLVNRSFVRSWVKEDGGYLLMEDKSQVPVSRNKKEQVAGGLLSS